MVKRKLMFIASLKFRPPSFYGALCKASRDYGRQDISNDTNRLRKTMSTTSLIWSPCHALFAFASSSTTMGMVDAASRTLERSFLSAQGRLQAMDVLIHRQPSWLGNIVLVGARQLIISQHEDMTTRHHYLLKLLYMCSWTRKNHSASCELHS